MKISKSIKSLLLGNEKRLPVINESGTVYGKVAYSQSVQMKNEYLHPIIRIALVHKGKLFLCRKANTETNQPSYLDYPFERHVLYRETIDKAVTKTFQSNSSKPSINNSSEPGMNNSCNYLFHYIYRNEETNRMVYFYVCNIRDESLLKKINQSNGKWWTGKQIKENLKTGLFSDLFENEFEFLNSTVLTIDK